MKKLTVLASVALITFASVGSADAQRWRGGGWRGGGGWHGGGGYYPRYYRGGGWGGGGALAAGLIGGALLGGLITAAATPAYAYPGYGYPYSGYPALRLQVWLRIRRSCCLQLSVLWVWLSGLWLLFGPGHTGRLQAGSDLPVPSRVWWTAIPRPCRVSRATIR